MIKGLEHLYFKVKGVTFIKVGVKRCAKGKFDLIWLKNLSSGNRKYVHRSKLEKYENV